MKRTSLILSVLVVSLAASASVTLVNPASVRFEQNPNTRAVTISYDLSGEPGIITLDIRTNGVSIGATNFRNISGDVNKKVQPGNGKTITWKPADSWPGHEFGPGVVTAVVTAWATNAPPPYMVVDLTTLTKDAFEFYPSAEAVPFTVTNDVYKTSKLVMRRIFATGIMWRMGDLNTETNRQSYDVPHLVVLTNDYYFGIYPVTQRQWANAYENGGASGSNPLPSVYAQSDRDTHPVENITWKSIRGDGDSGAAYNWPLNGHDVNTSYILGKMRAKTGILWDLPTVAQWEFACRAGTTGTNNVDGVSLDDTAWHSGLTSTTRPVGLKLPNAFGLYDMLGNVEELCLDRKGTTTSPCNADGTPIFDPAGATADSGPRSRKGGGYIHDKDPATYWCRPGITGVEWSQNAYNACMGFRLWCPAGIP